MTISYTNKRSNELLRAAISSEENLDKIATESSDENNIHKLQQICERYIELYPHCLKYVSKFEHGVSHWYSDVAMLNIYDTLLERRLTLNDIFTKLIFKGVEENRLNKSFLKAKSRLLKSGSDCDYKLLLSRIDSIASKSLKKPASPKWRMRIYRVLQHVLLDEVGLREVKIDDVSVENIIRCANIILRENPAISNERITPRYLDVLSAAKLILDATSDKNEFDLCFDPKTFEEGNFETRAKIENKFIFSRVVNSYFSETPSSKELSEPRKSLFGFLDEYSDIVLNGIRIGSKQDLVDITPEYIWLVRVFRVLIWNMQKSESLNFDGGDLIMPNILELSKKILANSLSYEEDTSIQHETLEAAVSFLRISKYPDEETLEMLESVKSQHSSLI